MFFEDIRKEKRKKMKYGIDIKEDELLAMDGGIKYPSDVCDVYLDAIESNDSYEWLTKDSPKIFAEFCMDYSCI